MRIIFLGAPGSGKGTQAEMIVQKYQIDHISTGDLLRAEVASGSELGQQAKAIMDAGDLVSDDIMLAMIKERVAKDGQHDTGFLLDGFPRTLRQAEALDDMLSEVGQPLDAVIFFDIDYGEITRRLLTRGRADDTEETIRKRLRVYEEQTAPLIDYYKEKGNLRTIQGTGEVEAIAERIFSVLDQVA